MSRTPQAFAKPEPIDDVRRSLEAEFGAFGVIVMPGESDAPILTPPVRAALHQWLLEMNAEHELAAVGLKARSRALLSGPPGCGKTTLAHHIAARLGVPMVVIQSASMVDSKLGGSGKNIAALFRAARRGNLDVALFLDEFDALAKSRSSLGTQACDNEVGNITIALLQEFDRHDGLIFAATNVTKNIDAAIWRRFQLQIEIGLPGGDERFAIVKRYLAPFEADEATIDGIADAFCGASPALIREGCESIKRALVLGGRLGLSNALADLMARFVASASPPEGVPEPELWANTRTQIGKMAALPWPPQRGTN